METVLIVIVVLVAAVTADFYWISRARRSCEICSKTTLEGEAACWHDLNGEQRFTHFGPCTDQYIAIHYRAGEGR